MYTSRHECLSGLATQGPTSRDQAFVLRFLAYPGRTCQNGNEHLSALFRSFARVQRPADVSWDCSGLAANPDDMTARLCWTKFETIFMYDLPQNVPSSEEPSPLRQGSRLSTLRRDESH